jgi:hypothetical protein
MDYFAHFTAEKLYTLASIGASYVFYCHLFKEWQKVIKGEENKKPVNSMFGQIIGKPVLYFVSAALMGFGIVIFFDIFGLEVAKPIIYFCVLLFWISAIFFDFTARTFKSNE